MIAAQRFTPSTPEEFTLLHGVLVLREKRDNTNIGIY
jgi:hypothetical protein